MILDPTRHAIVRTQVAIVINFVQYNCEETFLFSHTVREGGLSTHSLWCVMCDVYTRCIQHHEIQRIAQQYIECYTTAQCRSQQCSVPCTTVQSVIHDSIQCHVRSIMIYEIIFSCKLHQLSVYTSQYPPYLSALISVLYSQSSSRLSSLDHYILYLFVLHSAGTIRLTPSLLAALLTLITSAQAGNTSPAYSRGTTTTLALVSSLHQHIFTLCFSILDIKIIFI